MRLIILFIVLGLVGFFLTCSTTNKDQTSHESAQVSGDQPTSQAIEETTLAEPTTEESLEEHRIDDLDQLEVINNSESEEDNVDAFLEGDMESLTEKEATESTSENKKQSQNP
jgi:hypothetical protein